MKNNKNTTTEEFILKSNIIHGGKFTYSKSHYVNAFTKLCITCPLHGDFFIRPNNHLSGKQGCKKCGIELRPQNKPKSKKQFIENAINKHKTKYNYSYVYYVNNSTKIKIQCNRCNLIFEQTPNGHLNGQGCPICNRNHNKSIKYYDKLTKMCQKCKIEKSIGEYYIDGQYYRGNCKDCERQIKVEYRKVPFNKEKTKQYHKKYTSKRRKNDPVYRLRVDIPTIIRRAIKKKYYGDSIWNYLPYTPLQLKESLEKKFDDKMNWDNHGIYWHIDHIIPQASFHYDSETHPDFIKCWSLDNLRPFPAIDNMKKSSIFNGKRIMNKYLLPQPYD